MLPRTLATILFFLLAVTARPSKKRDDDTPAFFPPIQGGGSQLIAAGFAVSQNGKPPVIYGEPLNVIISGKSSPEVLTDAGFKNYMNSIDFAIECLGLHSGGIPMTANLGDGNGRINMTVELRHDYAVFGTCLESLIGGNHLRMFRQDGEEHNTGALFLAVGDEESIFTVHNIAHNGYNNGRDKLVKKATARVTKYGRVSYKTTSEDITGLLPAGNFTVNHGIKQDGIVKLLTVTIL